MSGRITTTTASVPAPASVSSWATRSAATIAVPHDSPARIPSSRVIRRAIANASRSDTRTQRSTSAGSKVPGRKSSPTPSVRYGRAVSPDRTLPSGSAPTTTRSGRLRAEVAGRPGDRPAGPHARHEMRDPPVGLLPDLGAGRRLVGGRVLLVPVLVRLERPGDVAGEPGGDGVVALRRLRGDVRRAEDDLGAVRPEHRLLLGRLLVGHDEDAAVALERGRDREAVAGVARRRLDDRAARAQEAGPLGRLDHRQADPVLDRPAGVERLELGEDERLLLERSDAARDPADPDQRRPPDEVEDGLGVLHGARV